MIAEAVQHASRSDRGELLAVADGDELGAGAFDQLCQRVEPRMVNHACLIEKHGRITSDLDAAGAGTGDESVERHRLARERRAADTKPLGCRAGHGHANRLAPGVLLSARGCVDDDPHAGARWTDKDRRALRPGEPSQCSGLLGGERRADVLGNFARRCNTRALASVAAGWPGGLCRTSFDRLLLSPDGERRHAPAIPNLKESTRRRYLEVWGAHLLPRLGDYQLREITPALVEDMCAQFRASRVGVQTQRKAVMLQQGILRRAVVRGLIPTNPVSAIDKPRQPPTKRPQSRRSPDTTPACCANWKASRSNPPPT